MSSTTGVFGEIESLPEAGEDCAQVLRPASWDRLARRWHLVAVGVSNVWKFTCEVYMTERGRLMWLASNGVGKTTMLEISMPFLVDLCTEPYKMSVGNGRHTRLETLMATGSGERARRIGYLWLGFESPQDASGRGDRQSYGVRIEFTSTSSTPIVLVPFRLPGDVAARLTLHGDRGEEVPREDFAQQVTELGGQVFEGADAYRGDLARRVFGCTVVELMDLCDSIRKVRDPRLLQAAKVKDAEKALREALPRVSEATVQAVGEALTAASGTRARYEYRHRTSELTAELAERWGRHVAGLAGDRLAQVEQLIEAHAVAKAEAELAAARHAEALEEHALADEVLADLREEEVRCEEDARVKGDAAMRSDERISATREQLRAADEAVQTRRAALLAAVEAEREREESLLREARLLCGDVNRLAAQAHEVDRLLLLAEQPVTARQVARQELRFGTESVARGDAADIHADPAGVVAMVAAVREACERHRLVVSHASTAVAEHARVSEASQRAAAARSLAGAQADRAEEDRQAHRVAQQAGDQAGADHVEAVVDWAASLSTRFGLHPRRPAPGGGDAPGEAVFSAAGIALWAEQTAGAEPGEVLACTAALAGRAHALAERQREHSSRRGAAHQQAAAELSQQAAAAAQEAEAFANGRLPAFPLPHWAGPGEEQDAFGAALRWGAAAPGPGRERDLLEAAIAATGLLGATLDAQAVSAPGHWRVEALGPVAAVGLDTVLAPEPGHPRAAAVTAVLARIALSDSADAGEDTGALVIGRDGTFRAGPGYGRIPGADDAGLLETAHHIGLDNRRAEAGRRAHRARREADALSGRAAVHRRALTALTTAAGKVAAAVAAFPNDQALRDADTVLTAAAITAAASHRLAADLDEKAQLAEADHRVVQEDWRARTEQLGLPADLERLCNHQAQAHRTADALHSTAENLHQLVDRTRDLAARADGIDRRSDAHEVAVLALNEHLGERNRLQHTLDAQLQIHGVEVTDIQQAHTQALAALQAAQELRRKAQARATEAAAARGKRERIAIQAAAAVRDPNDITQAADDLRTLLDVDGVAEALGGLDTSLPDDGLRTELASRLTGLTRCRAGEVRDAAEHLSAHLRGHTDDEDWRLEWAQEEDGTGVLPVRLARIGAAYAPPRAAELTAAASASAEEELTVAEQEALDDFVIGQIPAALGAAWQQLTQWILQANKRMLLAAASSGTGVQIRRELRPGLDPGLRRIYELTCKNSRASRTPEQEAEVRSELLAQLRLTGEHIRISSADTIERLKAVVDITSWIDISYMVHKTGQPPARLTDKSGVSGGEQRLIILAPMLAALAAELDRLHPAAPRLVALDEVPAEVDSVGKDGLARYISHLDLDIVCTSHGWDGSPDSWDGIDIYTLEKLPNDTVTASPIHVRENQLADLLEEILREAGKA
ncbi:SbcC/MukB-like Walker B domain-containing protein [Kitasatospora sp. NPDC058965]|uniref:SbcC/MukB-like Walker B domain-containing protein n=1 Tax=Kitasatospora sp. NPDC058965 TaxID=3346682 RepID=UPI0036CEED69